MSEEMNPSFDEAAREQAAEAVPASGGQEQPKVPEGERAGNNTARAPQAPSEVIAQAQEGQGQPASEVYIQPEEITPAGQPQYPPPPEAYAQAEQPPRIQNPYAAPQEPPRIQNSYAAPAPGYGAPNFVPPPMYGYGYEPFPQAQPLPLGQAIRQLPAQYRKILFKPGPRSFAEEQGKAEWGIIWVQILLLMLFEAILALPVGLVEIPVLNSSLSAAGAAPITSSTFLTVATIAVIIFAPIVFFVMVSIQYLLGRAFQGKGQFKQQAYNQLLFQVPTIFIVSLLYLIMTPFLSSVTSMLAVTPGSTTIPSVNPLGLVVILVVGLLAWAINIYGIVLNVFSIMAAHRISGGRATGVVLIPYAILLILYFGCICVSTLVTFSSIRS
jgi:hypothetical protein